MRTLQRDDLEKIDAKMLQLTAVQTPKGCKVVLPEQNYVSFENSKEGELIAIPAMEMTFEKNNALFEHELFVKTILSKIKRVAS